MEILVSIFDDLIFSDDLEPNFKIGTLSDAISFGDGVTSNIQYFQISEQLGFSDAVVSGGTRHLSIADTLNFTDSVQPRVWVVTINDFLFMYDALAIPIGGAIRESIDFVDVAVGITATPLLPDILTFNDVAIIQFLPHKTVVDSIVFSDASSCVLLNRMAPSTTVGYMPPTVEATIVFSDGVTTLTLPLPDFNDSDTITYTRINKTSRGYTPIITGIAGWFPKRARKLTFTYLTEQDTINTRTFFRRNAGLPVTLTDIYGDVRSVILQNPESEIAQVGRENRTLTLDLYVL